MNAIVNVNSTTPATMTSLEIVELINNERKTIEEITGKVQKLSCTRISYSKQRKCLVKTRRLNF